MDSIGIRIAFKFLSDGICISPNICGFNFPFGFLNSALIVIVLDFSSIVCPI
jgi:hypothetical protein